MSDLIDETQRAGWRMASTAMRVTILASRRDTFFAPIAEPHFEPVLP